ncbi:MAG: alanyl-tRNA editing protein [Clostridiales bacterium]|jgi:alanyl-tRNA synthetase|nr:alanyl-tRNA editing protein [Clostridiales bacterium]
MTEKLYFHDSYLKDFTAVAVACEKRENGYSVLLDKTAFFPNGGGQPADTGKIGDAKVFDVNESGGFVFHLTDRPVSVGGEVFCAIDWDKRFRMMQNHSGEHILSGIVNRLFGFDNVGFHMGAEFVTVDFNGFLDKDDLRRVEYGANEAVFKNVEIYSRFPSEKELADIDFRSKRDIDGIVRLIYIDGYDVCACCAQHVERTGEIGIIKIIDSQKYKGGTRLAVLCGLDALDDVMKKYEINDEISSLLSSKPNDTALAVSRTLGELRECKHMLSAQKIEMAEMIAASLKKTDGNMCVFVSGFDFDSLRKIVNKGVSLCSGVCAAFSGGDEDGYIYVAGSRNIDMQKASKEINSSLFGKGGGKPEMIQGSINSEREKIENFFDGFTGIF